MLSLKKRLSSKLLLAVLIFLAALVLRFWLTPQGFHVDIYSNAGWGEWIRDNGPLGFYENNVWIYSWPTQPPLVSLLYGFAGSVYKKELLWFVHSTQSIVKFNLAPGHMIWWFNFVNWFDDKLTPEIYFPHGFLISIKTFPILADLGIAGMIYYFAKRKKRDPIFFSGVYLFSPFTWYISSLWGQYDQISYLFTLVSFVLIPKLPVASPLFLAAGVSLKPTSAILVPFYLWLYFKRKPKLLSVVVGILAAIGFVYLTVQLFTTGNVLVYAKDVLVPKIFFKSEFRVSTNSFNFWHILTIDKALSQNTPFLFLPAKIWGFLAFAVINIKTFRLVKKLNYENIFNGLFLVGAGGWLFLTNMLERYFFIGVVSGLFVVIYKPKLFKYWIIMSLIFWINLYRNWWFPEFLDPLRLLLTAGGGIAGAFFSAANVLIYFILARGIFGERKY